MHDRHDHDRMNDDAGLAVALRALPAATPPHDAWPLLAARARRARRRKHGWRIAIPAALAAALALAIVLPDWPARNAATTMPATAACADCGKAAPIAGDEAAAQAWRTRSQRLQAWVHELDDGGAPLGGVALARAAELEDQIGLVDLQLGAGADAATQATLWHQRVVLLEALAMVRLSPSALATSDPHAVPDAIPVGARVD
jgi:hypothetical protein